MSTPPTDAERLILESQHTILHGIRILLSVTKAAHHQFLTMQNGMQRIDAYLKEHKK